MTNNVFWQQGEIQAGRVIPRPHAVDLAHTQTVLWPPLAIEINVRVGLIPSEDHLRWMIEMKDPGTHELLALRSAWARRISEVGYWPTQLAREIEAMLPAVLDPDPF